MGRNKLVSGRNASLQLALGRKEPLGTWEGERGMGLCGCPTLQKGFPVRLPRGQ